MSCFNDSIAAAMMKIENAVSCIIHLHKRVIEKILSFIFLRYLGEQESSQRIPPLVLKKTPPQNG
jgi:hypothetical protein